MLISIDHDELDALRTVLAVADDLVDHACATHDAHHQFGAFSRAKRLVVDLLVRTEAMP